MAESPKLIMSHPTSNNRSCCIRADANYEMGTGHIMRCLALMQALREKHWQVTLAFASCPDTLIEHCHQLGVHTHKLYPDQSDETAQHAFLAYLSQNAFDWVVMDGYHLDAAQQRAIKAQKFKLLVLDDNHEQSSYCADIILNQNIHAQQITYCVTSSPTFLLGLPFTLLRKEFTNTFPMVPAERGATPVNILLSLGGSDVQNLTFTLLSLLNHIKNKLKISVIIGPTNPHLEQLKTILTHHEISWFQSPSNMAKIMQHSDLAITGGGSTCWELAYLGLPAIIWTLAENQKQLVRMLHEKQVIYNMGDYHPSKDSDFLQVFNLLLEQNERRQAMAEAGQQLIDGKGPQRVVNAMEHWKRERK